MNFLWPAAWGFAALMLPVIAFYLVRTRLERRAVSSFLFWEGIPPQVYNQSLWRKLRRWLSLLLQILFLLLLVLALARPMGSGESEAAAREVIVLDASASMAASDVSAPFETRWDAARELARQRIARMRAFDTALLIEAGESPRVLHGWSRNRRALLRALESAQPSTVQADLPAALSLAAQLTNEGDAGAILISDGVWKEEDAPKGLEAVQTLWIGGNEPRNAGLTLFSARRSPAAPGEYQLVAQVEQTRIDNALSLEIRRNGQLFDVQPIPADGKLWEKSWSGSTLGEVRFEASLRRADAKAGDDLPVDDRAQVTLPALEPVTVELVAPPHTFLLAVLESLPMVEVIPVWPVEALAEKAPSPRTLTLFYQSRPSETLQREAMVIIAPGADGFWGEHEGALETPMVSDFDRESVALRYVALDQLKLHAAGSYQPAAGAVTMAESFGKPLIFGRWGGAAPRWLVLGFGLEESDLVFRTAFPILMGNLTQSLQSGAAGAVVSADLPGPIVTALASQRPEEQSAPQEVRPGVWSLLSAWPLWWWAVLVGAVWLVAEWGLFSRRITE